MSSKLWQARFISEMHSIDIGGRVCYSMPMTTENRRAKMMEMRLSGMTYAAIAGEMDVRRQTVQAALAPNRWIVLRMKRLAKGRCAGCAVKVGAGGQIHHKKVVGMSAENYNLPRNLALLCRTCHRLVHVQQEG